MTLAFMFLYKLGDSMATALSYPFYRELGFSLTEIGVIAKTASLAAVIIGALLGGVWMIRLGINNALWLFGEYSCSASSVLPCLPRPARIE